MGYTLKRYNVVKVVDSLPEKDKLLGEGYELVGESKGKKGAACKDVGDGGSDGDKK